MEPKGSAASNDLLKNVFQIGIVVNNVDEAMDNMRQIFGVEPTFVKFMDYPSVRYRGEEVEAKARVASYDHFGVQLEFMEPVGNANSIWWDHLREGATSGLHHIRFNDIESNEAITQYMSDRGIDIYQEGDSVVNPGGKFTYYDTAKKLGFVLEVVTKGK